MNARRLTIRWSRRGGQPPYHSQSYALAAPQLSSGVSRTTTPISLKEPAVSALIYRVRPGPFIVFDGPAPLSFTTRLFRIVVRDGELRFDLNSPVPSVDQARELADPFLYAWEIRSGLTAGKPEIQFEYVRPEFIDLNPRGTGPDKQFSVSGSATVSFEAIVQRTLKDYPEPPHDFVIDADVEYMWRRYQNYNSRNEPLLTMAYFCLTLFESLVGPGRKAAALKGQVDERILRKLGEFSSTAGTKLTARKVGPQFKGIPLSNKEEAWVDSCVRLLIRRLGELRAGASLQFRSMSDLPKL